MRKWLAGCIVAAAYLLCYLCSIAYADVPLKSSHFEFDESVVGGGGLTQDNSTNFQADEFIGDLAIGNSTSSNFQLNAGFDTTDQPALTFVVDTAGVSL